MSPTLFSGVKPTSVPHIGNYIGAFSQWTAMEREYRCLLFVADLHAITVPQDPKALRACVLDTAAVYFALGLDPKRTTVFVQSEVPEHLELAWMLGSLAHLGELERMTQFKDKSSKEGTERAGWGLFSYPVLMAADILLYQTDVVPVGEDQGQHLELTRVLARRFNDRFGETFRVPKLVLQKSGARIMSLQDPSKKMSKSDESTLGTIFIDDDADAIRKKIMKAVTDTEPGVVYDPERKPAVANLMAIYQHATGKTMDEIAEEFSGRGYGDFKKALAEAVVAHLSPIRERLLGFRADPGELNRLLDAGRDTARGIASKTVATAKDRMGLGR